MSTGKTVGLAIIIVVICPIILGMVWPTSTETVDVWDVQPAMDLTSDLADREITVYDSYTGPLNNLTVYVPSVDALQFPTPRATTDVPNAYPVSSIESTEAVQAVTISDMANSGKARYGIGSSTGMFYSGASGSYNYADYWPATNVLTLYDAYMNPTTVTPAGTDTITANGGQTISLITFGATSDYIDISQGFSRSSTRWVWLNGLENRSIEMWLYWVPVNFSNIITIDSLTLTRSADGTITVTDGTVTEVLGSAYTYTRIVLESDGTASVTGLIGVDSFQDTSFTAGNTVDGLTCTQDVKLFVSMKGTYISWWVKRTVSSIATTTGIDNSAFTPDSYWPSHAWQVQLINPSTFGSSIGIGGITYPVTDGSITVTNIDDGETTDMPVRGMRILSLVLDGQQHIYANGIPILTISPQAVTISLNGQWYMSVVLSEVQQGEKTNYIWDIGSFGFDQQSFCLVGLLSCVGVAIAGSVWGRTSGESVLALHITMILCGVAYLVMLD